MAARQIMSSEEIRRALVRISHEIVERQGGAQDLALVGIEHRGPVLAQRIAEEIAAREQVAVPVVALDVTPYRDDLGGQLLLKGSVRAAYLDADTLRPKRVPASIFEESKQ